MGKRLPETHWADSKINKIVIVASSWSFILFACNATNARCRQGRRFQWRPHFDRLSVIRSKYHSKQILQLYSVRQHYLTFIGRPMIERGCSVIVKSFLSMLPKSIDTCTSSHPLTWRYGEIQLSDVLNFKCETMVNIHKPGNSKSFLLIKRNSHQKSAWLIHRPTYIALNAFNVKSTY